MNPLSFYQLYKKLRSDLNEFNLIMDLMDWLIVFSEILLKICRLLREDHGLVEYQADIIGTFTLTILLKY